MRRIGLGSVVAALMTLDGAAALPAAAGAAFPTLDPARGVTTLAPLLARTTPAVVNISVVTRVPVDNPLLRDPYFRRFFNIPDRPLEREALSAGSGVIVDRRRGLVITNHHVVAGADRITVTLKDQREFDAVRVGSDRATDVALLRIDAEGLTSLPYGDSGEIEVGDLVLAIGNPFGLGQTVTSGIISALGRSGIASDRFEDFIQTDAAINPGNSGGALINSKGELIGINTAIVTPAGGNVGIGFAVPVNMVRAVTGQLLEHGEVRRGRIGIVIQDLSPAVAEAMRLDVSGGAVVAQVEPGSPASSAGLAPGDVVLEIDGSPVRSSSDLRNRLGLVEPDRLIELGILREGRRRLAAVRVAPGRRGRP